MKDNKIIKDLKERNRKLSRQYRERDIRCFTLERQIEEMKEENQKYKETIDKAINFILENVALQLMNDYLMDRINLANYNMKLLDILEVE